MKAAVFHAPHQPLTIEDVEIEKPKRREVLLRTAYAGLCHSDLHFMEGLYPYPAPAVLGHEGAAIVEAVGDDVTYVKPGDHVITCLSVFCGECDYCTTGHTNLCDNTEVKLLPGAARRLKWKGQTLNQAFNLSVFAENMLVHEHAVVKIDPEYPMDRAAVIGCGVCTGLGSVLKSAQVTPGSTVAVIGGGGVGLSAVQGARIAGARRIILVDIQPEKFALAMKAGATDCVDASAGDPVEQIKALTGDGVDYSFECLGLQSTCEQAVNVLRPGGLATIIGLGGDFTVNARWLLRGRRVQGAFMGSNNFRTDMQHYIELDQRGRLDVASLIEGHIALGEINAGYDAMRQRQIQGRRVIMFPQ